MNTSQLLDLMFLEREKIEKAIAALQGETHPNELPDWVLGKKAAKPTPTLLEMPKKKGQMSEQGKANIRAALVKRHAEKKAAKEALASRLAKARAGKKKKAA